MTETLVFAVYQEQEVRKMAVHQVVRPSSYAVPVEAQEL